MIDMIAISIFGLLQLLLEPVLAGSAACRRSFRGSCVPGAFAVHTDANVAGLSFNAINLLLCDLLDLNLLIRVHAALGQLVLVDKPFHGGLGLILIHLARLVDLNKQSGPLRLDRLLSQLLAMLQNL